MYYFLLVLFCLCSFILVGLVMLRKGEGGGLSGAFSGMGGESTFGVKAAKQLDKLIGWVTFVFLFLAILLSTNQVRHGDDSPDAETSGEESGE